MSGGDAAGCGTAATLGSGVIVGCGTTATSGIGVGSGAKATLGAVFSRSGAGSTVDTGWANFCRALSGVAGLVNVSEAVCLVKFSEPVGFAGFCDADSSRWRFVGLGGARATGCDEFADSAISAFAIFSVVTGEVLGTPYPGAVPAAQRVVRWPSVKAAWPLLPLE
jgi:hypothetical protein